MASLDGASQTLPQLYKLAAADFHDITSGSNGPYPLRPGPGYDLATGLGSPVANLLIPQLVGPTQLAFGQSPTSAGASASLSPAVTVLVEDSLGNVVASDTSSVTMAIGNNPGGGTLSGTLTVAAVNGVATFNNLSINKTGSGYTLVASDTTGIGPLTVTSAPFKIASPPTVPTAASATPNPVTGTSTNLSVLGADSGGEATLTYTWTATRGRRGRPRRRFSANGTNAAQNSTATFSKAGAYVLTATITNTERGHRHEQRQRDGQPDGDGVTVTPATISLARGRDAAIHGHGPRPVRRGPGQPAGVHLVGDDRVDNVRRIVHLGGNGGHGDGHERLVERHGDGCRRLSRRPWRRPPPPRRTR